MAENQFTPQRAVLISADTGSYNVDVSLNELSELANTAGAEVLAEFVQNRDAFDNATYIGKGKLLDVKEFCEQNECDLIIADDELSGSQLRNIEDLTGIQTVDRTMLILDIFAQRATSSEGKLQVELAQQKYLLPRLIGLGTALSRQGGGIGTRGPGETKLESDRRHIRRRIEALEENLRAVKRQRQQTRQKRRKNGIPTIAIVGYTNVGKSTLLNLLTESEIYVKDQLFATLDPTARELILPDGQHTVIIDTVGLIQRLPHHLVEAFHSTLEVAAEAQVILLVCDASDPLSDRQIQVTREVLSDLGCDEIPKIVVYNKVDRLPKEMLPKNSDKTVFISAKERTGIDDLLRAVSNALSDNMQELWLLIPYAKTAMVDDIRQNGVIYHESYENEGILVHALVNKRIYYKLREFTTDDM